MSQSDPYSWFSRPGFGVFLHWGLYSLLGRGEQVLFRERLGRKEYAKLARRFRGLKFHAEEWAQAIQSAGATYAVLTTKHHDGFCLFDSKVTEYTSCRTAAGRDFIEEYVSACRRTGLKVGLYYSLADWSQPGYFAGPRGDAKQFRRFVDFTHQQVRELCSNYGKIDVLWFDGGWPYSAADWRSEDLDRMIRRLQPGVMINDRLHGGGMGNVKSIGKTVRRKKGYFDTFEQKGVDHRPGIHPREVCHTMQNTWWGYHAGDRMWKTPAACLRFLIESNLAGANLLLNIGPNGNGQLPNRARKILQEMGTWMSLYRKAHRGVQGFPLDVSTVGVAGTNNNELYIYIYSWPGSSFRIHGLTSKVLRVELLGTKAIPLKYRQDECNLDLMGLPSKPPSLCPIVRIHFTLKPQKASDTVELWSDRNDLIPLRNWT